MPCDALFWYACLQTVKRRVMSATGHQLQPTYVVCDFEMSIKIAVENELPNAEVNACYFHFAQSLWRRVQLVGLAAAYLQHRSVRMAIRKITALAFLPLLLVRQNLNVFLASRQWQRIRQRYPAVEDFMNYFQRTYMTANGNFPPSLRNVFDRSISTRTNNVMEGWQHVSP